ncbi:MAG: hypothetical protein JWQ44_2661 [Chthoniobacter sp.]|nr:hypothetical protein [Chthoniobacter sp.]
MLEVFSEAIWPVNLPFTVLLGLVMIYWLLVALGALDDHDAADAEGDFASDGGWLSGVFHFINLGEAPLMVVMSILSLCLWTGSMIANHYFTDHRAVLALAYLLPNLLLSIVVTRYLTLPLKPIFQLLGGSEAEPIPLVGQPCRITTSTANETFGQAEIETKGAPLLINVRTTDGAALPRGAAAVVFREDTERGIYFVVGVPDPKLS